MRGLGCLVALLLVGAAAFLARDYISRHPQDVPWTELRLSDPVGRFTSSKLAALEEAPRQCRAMLRSAARGYAPVPPRSDGEQCGYDAALRLGPGSDEDIAYRPAGPIASCPLSAAMFLFEERVLQPAAEHHFGSRVAAIDHAGTYACRRIYGREQGRFSEHASANAFDITGFRLANGARVSVLDDWQGSGPKAAFLHDVRDGACTLFSTVLSPDYNAAHADHLHLDMAYRGRFGGTLCS